MPVLLLIGEREVVNRRPAAAIHRARRLLPGIQAEIVPGANHIAAMTNPEVVNQYIMQFFQAI